ncbi:MULTISPECIES: LbetaH domain-containing protein [spotted fever group]|uniref:Acetyltransferase n=2 Tax=spotted fever group TaxID=114277 RepID=H6QJ10_RICMA|nr:MULTISPECIES: acetyltransferase [spotted fever group]AFB31660.1 acetyltransferase [Rickettsia massiliae str. AZT80]KJV78807.1 putative chloramphenicol O-acetyltransferase [Rickettsia rhipicephali str. Ect]
MPGIKIADGAVVGARSLVTKNIGAYEIWGGNPAKLIKKRFSNDVYSKIIAN